MPSAYVRKVADEIGISVDEAEKAWAKAKEIAGDEPKGEKSRDAYWAKVTAIFKKIVGVKEEAEESIVSRVASDVFGEE